MKDDDYQQWMTQAGASAQAGIAAAKKDFGLGGWARWTSDLGEAVIRFFDADGRESVRADIQLAGTWAPAAEGETGTWMWGWANEKVPDTATARTARVPEVGRDKDVDELQAHVVDCEPDHAWRLAALAADITGADCVYHVGGARNQSFLLLYDLRKMD